MRDDVKALFAALASTGVLLGACSGGGDALDEVAERYVEMDRSGDPDPALAEALRRTVAEQEPSPRQRFLERQLRALALAPGTSMSFDDESAARYGVVAPGPGARGAEQTRAHIGGLLPGEGPLVRRYAELQRRFVIPGERRDRVLRAALSETRRRTKSRLEMPAAERVTIRWVKGKPWPAFHSYLGDFQSEIQVNEDYPLTIRSVLDIASHEGYPGHHVVASLLDEHLVRKEGWTEFTVSPPGTPQQLVIEGLSNYAVELVFPGEERRRFESEVLIPLAGLDVGAEEVERYLAVEEGASALGPLAVDGARRYLDRELDRVAAAIWLEKNALVVDAWAFLRFVDRYRTLVVTYTHGRELARRYLHAGGRDPWAAFMDTLTRPVLPEDLMDAT